MNILLVNYEYPPIGAGAANATYNIAKCMTKKGHQVHVLTSRYKKLKGYHIEEGIHVFRCPAFRKQASQSNIFEMFSFVLSASFILPVIIKRKNIDALIVFFSFPCGPLGLLAKIMTGKPYVVSLRGGDVPGNEAALNTFHKILTPIRRVVFKHAKAIVANSDGLKQLSESSDPYPVKIIPNGVDTEVFYPNVYKKNKAKVLYVGRFQSQKNLLFLLKEFDILLKEFFIDAELHLVGGGPMEKELFSFKKSLEFHNRIFIHPWCVKEALRKHYQEAICFVNPSFCEGMPNTVLEAMACGLPVIASHVPGNKELILSGETGFLFDLSSPEEFRKQLIRLLKDHVMAQKMGKNGGMKINQIFSWEHVAAQYLDLITCQNY